MRVTNLNWQSCYIAPSHAVEALVFCSFQEAADIAGYGNTLLEYARERISEEGRQADMIKGKSPAQVGIMTVTCHVPPVLVTAVVKCHLRSPAEYHGGIPPAQLNWVPW